MIEAINCVGTIIGVTILAMFLLDRKWYKEVESVLMFVCMLLVIYFLFLMASALMPQNYKFTEKVIKYDKITEIGNSVLIESKDIPVGKMIIDRDKNKYSFKFTIGKDKKLIIRDYNYSSCENSFPNAVLLSPEDRTEYELIVE